MHAGRDIAYLSNLSVCLSNAGIVLYVNEWTYHHTFWLSAGSIVLIFYNPTTLQNSKISVCIKY